MTTRQQYDQNAAHYEDLEVSSSTESDQTAAALAALACRVAGPVVELGVGTGRIAARLEERGVLVTGLDSSRGMLAVARRYGTTPLVQGSMTELPFRDRVVGLAYVVASTVFDLASAEARDVMFREVGRVLHPRGLLVLDAFVPHRDPVFAGGGEGRRTVVLRMDTLEQTLAVEQVVETPAGALVDRYELAYAWPEQLDSAAVEAGLRLVARWASWDRAAYDPGSGHHVSLYQADSRPRGLRRRDGRP